MLVFDTCIRSPFRLSFPRPIRDSRQRSVPFRPTPGGSGRRWTPSGVIAGDEIVHLLEFQWERQRSLAVSVPSPNGSCRCQTPASFAPWQPDAPAIFTISTTPPSHPRRHWATRLPRSWKRRVGRMHSVGGGLHKARVTGNVIAHQALHFMPRKDSTEPFLAGLSGGRESTIAELAEGHIHACGFTERLEGIVERGGLVAGSSLASEEQRRACLSG